MYNNWHPYGYYHNPPQTVMPKPSKTAVAYLKGGPFSPNIKGLVLFQEMRDGTRVCVEVTGLPSYQPGYHNKDPIGPHGFHIHENGICEIGGPDDPFQAVGGHWNPTNQPHGNHAGDMPVIFSNNGYAWMCFFTNAFKIADAIGKAVIIHQNPDDFRTQPAGDAGKRLACGVIEYNRVGGR